METRTFTLGDVLSVTTGRLVSEKHMDGIYDILNFMTGAYLYTHQLPKAIKTCCPAILDAYPFLAEDRLAHDLAALDARLVGADNPGQVCTQWVNELAQRFGNTFTLAVVPGIADTFAAPVADMVAMLRPDQDIIILDTREDT